MTKKVLPTETTVCVAVCKGSSWIQIALTKKSSFCGPLTHEAENTMAKAVNEQLDFFFITSKVDLRTPKVDLRTPKVELRTPKVELRIHKVELRMPKVELRTPKVELRTPKVELRTPKVEFRTTKVELRTPTILY